jgi:hypothetical protein
MDFILNATGLSWIVKTGNTKLGIREGHDCINSAIRNDLGGNIVNGLQLYTINQAGTDKDPKLVVVHSAAFIPTPETSDLIMFE